MDSNTSFTRASSRCRSGVKVRGQECEIARVDYSDSVNYFDCYIIRTSTAIGAGASTGIGTLLALALALVLVLALALELGQALAQKASPASAALAAACETWTAWEQYTTRHMQGGQRITETMTHKRVALQR